MIDNFVINNIFSLRRENRSHFDQLCGEFPQFPLLFLKDWIFPHVFFANAAKAIERMTPNTIMMGKLENSHDFLGKKVKLVSTDKQKRSRFVVVKYLT